MQLKYKSIIIKSSGKVDQLIGVTAPVYNPFVLDINTIGKIIVAGHSVYEVREDGKETRLTIDNYNTGDFILVTQVPPDTDHPDGDGYRHVSATGTTSEGKVLRAGSRPGEFGWSSLSVRDISGLENALNHNHDTSYASKNHTHSLASDTEDGMMSVTDYQKLQKFDENVVATIKNSSTEIVDTINNGTTQLKADLVKVTSNGTDQTLNAFVDGANRLIENATNTDFHPILCVNSLLRDGVQPLKLLMPKDGILKNVLATAEHNGNADCKVMVQYQSATDVFNGNNVWVDLLDNPIVIRPSMNMSDPLITTQKNISKNSMLRLVIISSGNGVKGLSVRLDVSQKLISLTTP